MVTHAGLVDAIQSTFPDNQSQLLATVLALGLLIGSLWLARRAADPLKEYLGDPLVETLEALVFAAFSLLTGWFLVVVWRAGPQVLAIQQALDISSADAIRIVFTAGILAVAYALTRLSKEFIGRLADTHAALSRQQQEIAHHLLQFLIFIVAGIVVLALWNVNPSGLVVGAGVLTVIIGLAARQTLGAVLAGFVVLLARPFEVGDWVVIDEREGVVTDVTIFNTELRTFDDEVVMIPNDIVTSQKVVNRSRRGRLRLEVDVGVDYDTDIEHAREVALDVIQDTELAAEHPDPRVVLVEFGGSSIVLRLRYWIRNPSARRMWKSRTQVVSRLKAAFDEAGIEIPFPQRTLGARDDDGGFRIVDETGAGEPGAASEPTAAGAAEGEPESGAGDDSENGTDDNTRADDDDSAGDSDDGSETGSDASNGDN